MIRFLLIFIFLLPPAYLVYFILIYFRTRVPYVGTPSSRLPRILQTMGITPQTVIYDLGCGKGDFLFAAEKFRPKKLVGFELSPLHAWYAQLKARLTRSRVEIHRQDFFEANMAEADIIYLFLVQAAVEKIWPKIAREAKPGTRVIILSNTIPGVPYVKMIRPEQTSGSRIYVYEV